LWTVDAAEPECAEFERISALAPKDLAFDPKAHSEPSTASRPPLRGRPVRQADAPVISAANGQPPWPLHGAKGHGDAPGAALLTVA